MHLDAGDIRCGLPTVAQGRASTPVALTRERLVPCATEGLPPELASLTGVSIRNRALRSELLMVVRIAIGSSGTPMRKLRILFVPRIPG